MADASVIGTQSPIEAVVFDVGGVLIDWNPRYLYRKLFRDDRAMEHFLTEVCSPDWNEQADAGRPTAEITAELCRRHPDMQPLIESYYTRFSEMMKGSIDGTVELVDRLHTQGLPLYVLSNFSAETFPLARQRFGFFDRFAGMVISGVEGMKKPDRRIYDLLIERFALPPARTLFVDDRPVITEAARAAGWQALHFTSAAQLAADFRVLGLLGADSRPGGT
ncbi:MAG: HAD family hydrolase [Kiloniellaceae bacterium]